jgi:hypothetical protein
MSVYAVLIRWVGSTPNPAKIEGALSPVADWLRFNTETWFVETQDGLSRLNVELQKVLTPSDSVMIVRIDPSDRAGSAPPEVWNWLLRRSTSPLVNALMDRRSTLPSA